MGKKKELSLQEKRIKRFGEFVQELKQKAIDNNMSFRQYIRKNLLNKPLGDLGQTIMHGNFFSINVLKARRNLYQKNLKEFLTVNFQSEQILNSNKNTSYARKNNLFKESIDEVLAQKAGTFQLNKNSEALYKK